MSDPQEIVFEGTSNWRSSLQISLIFCVSPVILGFLLNDMKSGTTHPLPSIPWAVVYFLIGGGIAAFLLILLAILLVKDQYVYHRNREEFSSRFSLFGFSFSHTIGGKADIVGISVNSEQTTNRYETIVWTYYQAALGMKNGRVYPLSPAVKDGYEDANEQAKSYADVMKVPYVEGRGNTAMEVLDVGGGKYAIVHHAHKLIFR